MITAINIIELKEFENISIPLENSDLLFLKKFHYKHLRIKQISKNEYDIKANSYIGLIELPSKIRIVVKPKIKITNLLYIISFTYDLLKFKNFNKNDVTNNSSLIDIYIIVFINWLEILIKKGLSKSYQTENERINSIKGKIRITENLIKSEKIFCEFDELTVSTKENQI